MRAAFVLLAAVSALVPASTARAVYPQDWVFYAWTTAVSKYYLQHGNWSGMTTATLAKYNPHLRYVRVVRASKSGFCIQATIAGVSASLAGPNNVVKMGTCAHPGKTANVHVYSHAENYVRMAIPAVEAWNADHNTYAGLTLAGLRSYDAAVKNVRIIRATKTTYCIEGYAGIWVAKKDGPRARITSGRCRP